MNKGILTVDFLPRKTAIYTKFTIEYQDVPELIKLLEKFLKEKNESK